MRGVRLLAVVAGLVVGAGCFGGVFGSDYRACGGDTDCKNGERCLATRGGNVCVDAPGSACTSTPGRCPDGTTCAPDGVCRTTCNVTGGLSCVVGQVCSGAVCVGSDPHHDPGVIASGAGGMTGAGGAASAEGGMTGAGGAASGAGGAGAGTSGAGAGAAAGAGGSGASGGQPNTAPTTCGQARGATGCCGPGVMPGHEYAYYCNAGDQAPSAVDCTATGYQCEWFKVTPSMSGYGCTVGYPSSDPGGTPRACGP
jgi:hypothetical protein